MASWDRGAAERLAGYVERIEALEADKVSLQADIREQYAEAKGEGFDAKVLRQVIQLRKLTDEEREERRSLLELYMHALEDQC